MMRHLDMIKGRDGVGGFSMSENALPIFNQLIKLMFMLRETLKSSLKKLKILAFFINLISDM